MRKFIKQPIAIYFMILMFTALALGFSNDILSNYFKDAYNVTAMQRGLIEFPRELPGVLLLFIITGLSFLGDIRVAMIAQLLSIFGILILGLITPTFGVMLIFIFINSVGMHMFFPLQDAIGLSLIKGDNVGRRMGQFKGVFTAFTMTGMVVVFFGFRSGVFSFTTQVKWVFVLAAISLFIAFLLLLLLNTQMSEPVKARKKMAFVFRKEYKYYYFLTILYGVQKQIVMVYGPWVIIDLLGKKADTIAILSIIGAFVGIFFIPLVGKILDKVGIKTMLYADAISFILVYILFAIASGYLFNFEGVAVGLPVLMVYVLFIFDKMSNQMGMVRTLYLRSIAVSKDDITPTLSMGISLDHVVSILCAMLGGVIWSQFGPQYVFVMAAVLSLGNLFIATKVKDVRGFKEIL